MAVGFLIVSPHVLLPPVETGGACGHGAKSSIPKRKHRIPDRYGPARRKAVIAARSASADTRRLAVRVGG